MGTGSDAVVEPQFRRYIDPQGRVFEHAYVDHGSADLAVHFSAFFGGWTEARRYRETFGGYFHRLKMLGTCPDRNWLFLCDSHGVERNGCYYLGERGDLFVQRAMLEIIRSTMAQRGDLPERVVTVGSSMGATAAITLALLLDLRGVVAISPHIDLDTSARMQGREAHVAFAVADGETQSPTNHPITRQIRALVEEREPERPLPRLFVQSCTDDVGVHHEQVEPLLSSWRAKGGACWLDERPSGGHTSDWATRPLLLDVIASLRSGEPPDVRSYQSDPIFAGGLMRPPFSHRMRGRVSRSMKSLGLRR